MTTHLLDSGFSAIVPFIMMIVIFIISAVASQAKKAKEAQAAKGLSGLTQDPAIARLQARAAHARANNELSYDERTPESLEGSVFDDEGALDTSALTTGGAASVKRAGDARRHREGSNIRPDGRQKEESQHEERLERLFEKYPKQALLASEVLGPPRCKRPIRG